VSPLVVGLSTAVGAAGGALLPLTAYRLSVPADEPARDACASCGRALPRGAAGWIRLPARCEGCGVRLGRRAWLTAAAAGVASGVLAAVLGPTLSLPLYVAMAILGVLLGVIDLDCKRLPHRLVSPAIWISGVLFAGVAAITGEWGTWLRAVLGAVVLGLVFLVLYLVPGQGLGYGDVKLAVLLGLFLGWLGWRAVLFGGLFPWLVNGPVVLVLLLLGRVGRRSALPFGPAMLTGAFLAAVGAAQLSRVPWF
jgi:leader peptidase (prepilin peptidase)/N-methyltransferase